MKKLIKIFSKILIILIFLLVLMIFGNYVIHIIKSKNEYKELKDAGYINKYSTGDYNLNLYRIGNKNSKYKLIGISGLGVDNFSIEMTFVNEKLKEDYEIIYIDRAGYGYSDDTNKKQTIEQVVSDYRTVLKNAGINGPYILMPHSLGGLYATYWESNYPDEINGVILIDSSELGIDVWDKKEYNINFIDYLELFATKIGLHRINLRDYVYPLPSIYSKTNQMYSDYLSIHALTNNAKISEINEINNNTNITYNSIISNDIPKIYICSHTGFRNRSEFKEHLKWIQNRQKEIGMSVLNMPSDKKIDEQIMQFIEWEDKSIKPYINKLGNTKIIYIPGDHMIFEEKPEELAKEIKKFIKRLNNKN
ncbi:MAG: alpha/beta fold hydrolase [Bacilli bacterium]